VLAAANAPGAWGYFDVVGDDKKAASTLSHLPAQHLQEP